MEILSYEGFAEALKESLPVFLGSGWKLEERDTFRINEKKPTLNIYREGESERKVMPNIYLDDYYREYEEGREICSILGEIADLTTHVPDRNELGFSLSADEIRNSTVMIVINAASNEEFLKRLPHRRFLDLAVVLRAVSFQEDGSSFGAMITREIADSWGLSDDELFSMARKNSSRLVPAYVFGVEGVLTITNLKGSYGAINGLCNNEVLKDIAEVVEDDIFIIPSSVHEVFAVPVTGFDADGLRSASHRAVKAGVVSSRDFLSRNIYRYDRDCSELRII